MKTRAIVATALVCVWLAAARPAGAQTTAGSGDSAQSAAASSQAPARAAKRVNELTLGGLRPGKDTLATAEKLYAGAHKLPSNDSNMVTWEDPCQRETLRVEADDAGIIQFVTAQAEENPGDCANPASVRARNGQWKTGHGLGVGDAKTRVTAIYGDPGSSGPSEGDHKKLVMMYYAFDWAGSDVPQVMEVYCDQGSGRVVEITLSGPSL